MKKKQTRELEVAFSRGENKCTVKVQICFAQHSTLAIESWQGIARGILLVKLLIKVLLGSGRMRLQSVSK